MDARVESAEVGDVVVATFTPKRAALTLDGARAIGWRGQWHACWRISGGDFARQLAWQPRPVASAPVGWAPSEDLDDVEDVAE